MSSSGTYGPSLGRRVVAFVMILFGVSLLGPGPRAESVDALGPESKVGAGPLSELPDPVLVQGKWVPVLLGSDLGSLRLLTWGGRGFVPIRFQVDERTSRGKRVFPSGRKNNREAGNQRLDQQDEILFMAKEAGPRAPGGTRPEGAIRLAEIGLTEGVTGARGWVYLVAYPGKGPPLSRLPAFVHYDPVQETLSSDCFRTEFLVTEEGLHTSYYLHQMTPVGAGGSGRNILDRLKLNLEIRFFFNLLPLILNEEKLGSDVVGYIQGPIRVVRRQEQFLKLPFGLRAVGTLSEMATYESMAIVPITLHVPQGIGRVVSSVVFRYGTDYAPNVVGALFRNSEMEEPFIVDGRMSEAERLFPTQRDNWRMFYGPDGFLMARFFIPEPLLNMLEIRQGYIDDIRVDAPPERFPGSIGYAYTEIRPRQIRSGVYHVSMDLYFPCDYHPGDEGCYLRFRDHPIVLSIQGRSYPNPLGLIEGETGSR